MQTYRSLNRQAFLLFASMHVAGSEGVAIKGEDRTQREDFGRAKEVSV